MQPRDSVLQCGPHALGLGRARIMGILNVTPDSFSDGGQYGRIEAALDRARAMVEEGADILDIGGESTRPGAAPVSLEEERRRVLPVIEALRAELDIPLSVDTMKPSLMRDAVKAGAGMLERCEWVPGCRCPGSGARPRHVTMVRRFVRCICRGDRSRCSIRPTTKTWLPRSGVSGRARRGTGGGGSARRADCPRPGVRFRQDAGAQYGPFPGAATARDRALAGAGWGLAQVHDRAVAA